MQLCLRRWIALHARVNGDVKRGAFPLAALGILCGAAHAGDLPEQHRIPSPSTTAERHSGWETQVSLYGWTPALAGKVGIRNLPSIAIDMPISDVLSDLDGAVMASVFANNDRWLLLADLVFARLSDTAVAAGRTVDATITQTIATGAVGAMLPTGNPQFDFAVTGGLRYVSLNGNLSLGSGPRLPTLSAGARQWWLDPTIGFFSHYTFADGWFVNAIADIGGFGAGSKLSSTGYGGVGYMWNSNLSTSIGYRYLYENYSGAGIKTGTFRYNTTMHGPTVSIAWHF